MTLFTGCTVMHTAQHLKLLIYPQQNIKLGLYPTAKDPSFQNKQLLVSDLAELCRRSPSWPCGSHPRETSCESYIVRVGGLDIR